MLPGKKYGVFDILLIVWQRRWLIIVPAVIGGYLALVASSRLVDQYESEMLIQVVPQRVPDSYVKSTVTMRTEDRLNALQQQVMSRTELEKIVTSMNLYPSLRTQLPMEDVISRLRNSLHLEVVKSQQDNRDTDAFFIRFTYPDREVSMQVTEKIGALFIDMNANDRGRLADATSTFLEAQLVEARKQLEENEKRLQMFQQRNAGRLPSQVQFNMQAIQNAQLQATAMQESLARDRDLKLTKQQSYDDLQHQAPVTRPAQAGASANDASLPAGTAQQQLAAARDLLARMTLQKTDAHPDVQRLKRQVTELEQRAAAEAASTAGTAVVAVTPEEQERRTRLQALRTEIDSLERQIQYKQGEEARLQRTIADFQARLEQTPGVESESIALMRDYQTLQETYKDLKQKSEQAHVAAELEERRIGEQFRVLDPARTPARPTGIKRMYINLGGTGAGLALGVLIAAFLEFKDSTYHSANEVLDVLKLPVLAVVPRLVSDDENRRAMRRRLAVSAVGAMMVVAAGYGFWALQLWKHLQ